MTSVWRWGAALGLAAVAGGGLLLWQWQAAPAGALATPQAGGPQAVAPAPAASMQALPPAPPGTVPTTAKDSREAFTQAIQRAQAQPPLPPVSGVVNAKSFPEAFAAMQAAQRAQEREQEQAQRQASGAGLNPFGGTAGAPGAAVGR